MDTQILTIKKASSPLQWLKIRRLYHSAFPRKERKPFGMIVSMCRKGKTDVWYAERAGRFAGFAATINGGGIILIDYLAVPKKQRGQGLGSVFMRALKECYAGKGLFVEIESTFEDAENMDERMGRKRFYESNGFEPLDVVADVFGVKMELLGLGCRLDFAGYQAFYRDNYGEWSVRFISDVK